MALLLLSTCALLVTESGSLVMERGSLSVTREIIGECSVKRRRSLLNRKRSLRC